MAETTYFAADYRERRLRTPELGFWIWYVEVALSHAGMLSRGTPMTEKPSKDHRRLRWQLIHDVRHLRAWLASNEIRGFGWVASVFEAMLGEEAFNQAGYVAEIEKLLATCEGIVEQLHREIVRKAVFRAPKVPWPQWRYRRLRLAIARGERTYRPVRQLDLPLRGLCPAWDALSDAAVCAKAVSGRHVPRQVQGSKRVLRQTPRPGAKGVGDGRKQKQEARVERKQVAEDPSANPRTRRLSVPVRGMRRCR